MRDAKKRSLWCFAALLLLSVGLALAEQTDTQRAQKLQDHFQGWPRFSDTDGFSPLEFDYYVGFLGWSAVFLGAAFVFTVVGVLFLCCGICFCSCVRIPSSTYNILLAVLLILFLITTGFVGYDAYRGFQGEDDFHEGILSTSSQTLDFLSTESENVIYLLADIIDYQGVFADNITIPQTLIDFSNDLKNVTVDFSDFQTIVVEPVEDVRHNMSLATFIILCIICTANIVGILLRNRMVYIIGGVLAALMIGVMMASAAVNIAPILFLSDSCPDLDTLILDGTPQFIYNQVDYMLFCNGTYQDVWSPLPQSLNETLVAINASIEATNNQTIKNQLIANYEYVERIQNDTFQILGCNYTSSSYSSIKSTVCVPLFLGLYELYRAELFSCLFVAILLVLFIVCAIRRGKIKDQHHHYHHLDNGDEEAEPLLISLDESSFVSPAPVKPFEVSSDHYAKM